jgi:ribosomal protein L7/L12
VEQRDANDLVEEYVRRIEADTPLIVFPELTETHDFGWIIFYGSADPSNPVAGNGPVIVDRNTGDLYPTGTAYPLAEYVNNFKETGDPHRRLGRSVTLNDVQCDEHRIEIVKTIRELTHLSLGAAKKFLDDCLDGMKPTVRLESNEIARELARRLTELGMNVTQNQEMR